MSDLSLFDQPRARESDPETSHAAAVSVQDLTPKRAAVYRTLQGWPRGLTDEQIAQRYTGPVQSPSGLRTRRAELVELRLVRDSGVKVRMSTGRLAIVWKVQP